MGITNAAVATEQLARSTADTAIAADVTALTTTVGGNTASIGIVAESVDGIEAKYGVSIDNNGNASGFQLLSGAGGSAFNVRADQFAIWDSAGNGGAAPFTVFTSSRTIDGVVYPAGTYIKNAIIDDAAIVTGSITTAKIQDLAVDTLQIAGNAVTVAVYATGANVSLPSETFSTVVSAVTTKTAGLNTEIAFTCDVSIPVQGTSNGTLRLEMYRDSTVIEIVLLDFSTATQTGSTLNLGPLNFTVIDKQSSSSLTTYSVKAGRFNASNWQVDLNNIDLRTQQYKR